MKAFTVSRKHDPEATTKASLGRLVAQVLSGAWRPSSPPLTNSSGELEAIAELLTTCGAGGLSWRKVRDSNQKSSPAGKLFQAQYRFHSLQAALRERSLKRVIPLLRDAGVEPLLLKGWAIARMYPEPGMRPYIDLDLCVLPNDYARANKVLRSANFDRCNVDLHNGFGKFYDTRTDEIFARSELVRLDDLDVRVLSPEDNLRFLCLHLLRHGAVQPLWLCDICLLLESRAPDFDWDRCMSGNRKQADWVACAIGLTHQIFDTALEGTPVASRARRLPGWLVCAVLEAWGTPLKTLPVLAPYLRDPRRWLSDLPKELPRHWPNPIEATMTVQGAFNGLPRLPFQVAHVISRIGASVSELLTQFTTSAFQRS